MMLRRLRHAEQRIQLRQQALQGATFAQHLEETHRLLFCECAFKFRPDTLGDQCFHFTGLHERAHQYLRLVRNRIAEARGKARHSQHPQRVFGERRRNMPQNAALEVGRPVEQINQPAGGIFGHRIDSQVTAREILLQRHIRPGVHRKPLVTLAALALGTRQRVLLLGLGWRNTGKSAPTIL